MAMSRQRGYQAKRRNTGERKRKSLILLSIEGKNKTETQYFTDMARALSLNIRFAPGNYTDPVHMVAALKKACKDHDLGAEPEDKAFCIVDSDVSPDKNGQLAKADSMSRKEGIILIVSSPCFEVWCLCHYGSNSTHYQNNAAVVDDLLKKLPGVSEKRRGAVSCTCS